MKNSKLHSIKNSGFKTPHGYFANLDEVIMRHTRAKTQVSSPGFKVPNHYFNTLENAILNKTTVKPVPVFKLFSKRNMAYATCIAAAILIFFSIYFNNSKTSFESLAIDTLEAYINEETISDLELTSLFSETDLLELDYYFIDVNQTLLDSYILKHSTSKDFMNIEQ